MGVAPLILGDIIASGLIRCFNKLSHAIRLFHLAGPARRGFFGGCALTGDIFAVNTRVMKISIALIVVGTRMGRMV